MTTPPNETDAQAAAHLAHDILGLGPPSAEYLADLSADTTTTNGSSPAASADTPVDAGHSPTDVATTADPVEVPAGNDPRQALRAARAALNLLTDTRERVTVVIDGEHRDVPAGEVAVHLVGRVGAGRPDDTQMALAVDRGGAVELAGVALTLTGDGAETVLDALAAGWLPASWVEVATPAAGAVSVTAVWVGTDRLLLPASDVDTIGATLEAHAKDTAAEAGVEVGVLARWSVPLPAVHLNPDVTLDTGRTGGEGADHGVGAAVQTSEVLTAAGMDLPAGSTVIAPAAEVPQHLRSATELRFATDEAALVEDWIADRHLHEGAPTLAYAPGVGWREWDGRRWVNCHAEQVGRRVLDYFRDKMVLKAGKGGKVDVVPLSAVSAKITSLQAQATRIVQPTTSGGIPAPTGRAAWLTWDHTPWAGEDQDVDVTQVIPVGNGALDLTTRTLRPPTPRLWTTQGIVADWDPTAPCPTWERVLEFIYDGDVDTIATLQEWFGYVVSGSTNAKKMLIISGPHDSGKSLIVKVMVELVGMAAATFVDQAHFDGRWALSDIEGKSLAIIPDARTADADVNPAPMVRQLLVAIGDQRAKVESKGGDLRNIDALARWVGVSNGPFVLPDRHGAMRSRLIAAPTPRTIPAPDRANPDELLAFIVAELPGVLRWALDGLDRLQANGWTFTESAAAREALAANDAASNPVETFLTTRCVAGPERSIPTQYLHEQFMEWYEDNVDTGRHHPAADPTGTPRSRQMAFAQAVNPWVRTQIGEAAWRSMTTEGDGGKGAKQPRERGWERHARGEGRVRVFRGVGIEGVERQV